MGGWLDLRMGHHGCVSPQALPCCGASLLLLFPPFALLLNFSLPPSSQLTLASSPPLVSRSPIVPLFIFLVWVCIWPCLFVSEVVEGNAGASADISSEGLLTHTCSDVAA